MVARRPRLVHEVAQPVAVDAGRTQHLQPTGDGALPTATAPRETNHEGESGEVGGVLKGNQSQVR